ncbi:hypothetical protein MRY82_01380 [bacterium]|nr:hypothetical protein [bacterium]
MLLNYSHKKIFSAFTLIELMFVIVLLALFARLTLPKFNQITRGNLRSTATKLSGFFKAAHDRAIMRSEHIRIYFDLDANTYWASVFVPVEKMPLLDSSTDIDDAILAFEKLAEDSIGDSEPEKQEATFETLKERNLKKSKLPSGLRIKHIYKASIGNDQNNINDVENEGRIYLDFYPNGFSTQSIVYLENDYENIYSIIIPPIGGQSRIEKGEVSVF